MHNSSMLLLSALLVGGCHGKRDAEARRPDDPTKSPPHDVAPTPEAKGERFVLVQGDVVDLDARTASIWFTPPPRFFASDARAFYVVDEAEVRAFAPPTTGARWTTSVGPSVGKAVGIAVADPWI